MLLGWSNQGVRDGQCMWCTGEKKKILRALGSQGTDSRMILKWILNRMGGHQCSHLDEDRHTVMELQLIYIKCRDFLDSWGTVSFPRMTLLHGANLHNLIYKGLPFSSHSSQLIQIHLFLGQFSNVHLNIIIPFAHISSMWSLTLHLPHKIPLIRTNK